MNIDQERGIKNLLIIGRTKVGKSTLCNVLCDINDFDENENLASKTRSFQDKVFVWKETEYNVIEIGVSSIRENLYNRIGEVQKGISQVLLLVDERFTAEEIRTLESFEKENFNTGIVKYTTIVRTKFENFKIEKKCEEDKKQMCCGSEAITKIFKSSRDIIYVDNPPIDICIEDEVDIKRVENHKKIRARSRIILLNHLEIAYQEDYSELTTWDWLLNKIAKYIGIGNVAEAERTNHSPLSK